MSLRQTFPEDNHINVNIVDIKRKAMALPVQARAELAEYLLASLDDLAGQELEALWIDQAEKRYQEYLQGTLTARPFADAFQEAKERLR